MPKLIHDYKVQINFQGLSILLKDLQKKMGRVPFLNIISNKQPPDHLALSPILENVRKVTKRNKNKNKYMQELINWP